MYEGGVNVCCAFGTINSVYDGVEARAEVRRGNWRNPTCGWAPDYVQGNVAILPAVSLPETRGKRLQEEMQVDKATPA